MRGTPTLGSPLMKLKCAVKYWRRSLTIQEHNERSKKQIGSNHNLLNDLDAAKLITSQLEAVLEATIEKVDAKTLYLNEREKMLKVRSRVCSLLHTSI
ncbi:hypothetical protein CARUB_v10028659mg [Capsella rubella]|uniref:Uncharacterized protein n=1 Tax=Capsella rubella TaxID=81985 RepID=R0GSE1_9BRAS|nr:hypothetical protein CARUB_v10028659mg [Capsella rubella]